LSDSSRRESGHKRDCENGARCITHLRFLLGAVIELRLRPIKPPHFALASLNAAFGVTECGRDVTIRKRMDRNATR
jgi:hypothetical protein